MLKQTRPFDLGIEILPFVIQGLQTTEEHKVALPANWPNNELFGADAIIPTRQRHYYYIE